MRRSVENAEHVGLFVPTILESPPTQPLVVNRTAAQRTSTLSTTAVMPSPPQIQTRAGSYLPPARAVLPTVAEMNSVGGSWRVLGSTMPQVQTHPPIQAPNRQPAPVILTPTSSTESLRSDSSAHTDHGRVDTRRADDPFFGSRTTCRPAAPQVDPHSENIPQLCLIC